MDGWSRREGELFEITAGSVAFNVTPLLFMTSPLSSFFPFAVLQDCPTISAQGFKDNAWRSSLVFGQRQAGPRISYEPKSRIGSPGRSGNDPGGPRASSCLPLCDLICCPLIAPFLSIASLSVYTSFLMSRCHDHCRRVGAAAAALPSDGFQPCNYPSLLN